MYIHTCIYVCIHMYIIYIRLKEMDFDASRLETPSFDNLHRNRCEKLTDSAVKNWYAYTYIYIYIYIYMYIYIYIYILMCMYVCIIWVFGLGKVGFGWVDLDWVGLG